MKWRVDIKRTLRTTVEVEAPDYSAARQAAYKLACRPEADWPAGFVAEGQSDVRQQLGEPWCSSWKHGWYDLHGPGDVVVVEAALGNRFTQADIDLLRARVEATGCTVIDSWNGAGCDTVSFQCGWSGKTERPDTRTKGNYDPSTRPAVSSAMLCAPREKP